MCECGERLSDDFECMACSKTYHKQEDGGLIETTNKKSATTGFTGGG